MCREACLNFLELCKQKNEDKLWMDEIAAMQVSSQPVLPYLRTSGIILAGEDDSGSKINGVGDASVSDSTPSHASLDIGQGKLLSGCNTFLYMLADRLCIRLRLHSRCSTFLLFQA